MAATVDETFRIALELSDESKACLAERLVVYRADHAPEELRRQQLQVRERRERELASGEVTGVPREQVARNVRRVLGE